MHANLPRSPKSETSLGTAGPATFDPVSGIRRFVRFQSSIALAALLLAGCTSSSDVSPSAVSSHVIANRTASEVAARTLKGEQPLMTLLPDGRPAHRVDRNRDAYVFLSGGGSPLSNNYSQYL